MLFRKLFYILIISSISTIAQSNVIHEDGKYYFADRIVVKYKQTAQKLSKVKENLYTKLGVLEETKTFTRAEKQNPYSENLNKIYTLKFSAPFNPVHVAKEIKNLPAVEWAEPHYLYELVFDPNDPVLSDTDVSKFYHLDIIKAKEAWDINDGNEDIIIAIIDTGVDWEHPDLNANIWINVDETPDNGVDDDQNGYVDDIRGWDFGGLTGTPDNNPREDAADHGTHVAGLSGAVTNNGVGIASIGFNSSIMAVKTAQDDIRNSSGTALIAYGYEGIKYAADNGAHIINCSWGGYSYSHAAQDIINYAISKGSLVVGAAGNDNSSFSFYPASYDGVLSVAATGTTDRRASWSNYGLDVDVTSPGVNIYSTWQSTALYSFASGTSMAAPITAGLAALVANQFPNYSPLQIAEQIRVTSDNIDSENTAFEKKIGSGRINAFSALSNTNAKSVRITNSTFLEVGDGDGIYESGEVVRIKIDVTNYLNPINNLMVNLSTTSTNVEIVKAGSSLGALATNQSVQTSNDFFEISIKENAEENVDIELLVIYSDEGYSDYEWITLSINPRYQIHRTENLVVTFNSSGSIGFDDYPTNLKGSGLTYKDGPNLMFEGALVYGTSASTIANVARDKDGNKDNDFNVLSPIIINSPGSFSDKESYSKFNDENASPQSLGIETEVFTYSFSDELDADYIVIRYVFKNTTSEIIENFYAGQYWDFDMDDTSFDDDKVAFNTNENFGYAFDDDGDPVETHVGFTLLSEGNLGFFAMDHLGRSNPTISWDGFDDEEKWTALSSGTTYKNSGPNDISLMISAGPFNLQPNVKNEIDFLLAAGDNLTDLTNNIARARVKYVDLPTDIKNNLPISNSFSLDQNYPNPFNPTTTIKYSIPSLVNENISVVKLNVFDVLGQEIITLVNKRQASGNYEVEFDASNIPSGVYFYRLSTQNYTSIKKMVLIK